MASPFTPTTSPAPSGADLPLLLSSRQAAALAGIPERSWWRFTHSGRAPKPIKLTPGKQGLVRFRRDEVEAWVAAGCPRVAQ